MPAVAEPRHPAERELAVAAHPDRRMRLLHRMGQAAHGLEAVELAAERGGVLGPQGLEDAQVLVTHRAAPVEGLSAERIELLTQPAHPDADRDAALREHVY